MSAEFKQLRVSDLLLDIKNPRFDPVNNQRNAIKAMMKDQGSKLYQLACDICQYGLDPSKRMIVFKSQGKYIDGDGNRRLVVLKILETPNLIDSGSLKTKFLRLSKKYTPIVEVECVVFQDRKACKHWIQINHDGLQGGRGQDPWSPEQKERFNGKKSIGVQAIDFLLSKGSITQTDKSKVNKSTLDRVLGAKVTKTALSISKQDNKFEFNDQERLLDTFNAIKGKKVDSVYTTEKIEVFLRETHGSLSARSPMSKGTADRARKKSNPRKTPRTKSGILFGEVLELRDGIVNNIYRDICEIYDSGCSGDKYAEILGMSMRLLLDIAAHEYFKVNPEKKKSKNKDNEYADYLKLIKEMCSPKEKNSLTIDPTISTLINESKLEAFLPKLAHGTAHCSRGSVLNLSLIIGPILKIHFSRNTL